jgi:RNA polymerase sigma-70 factor (ECF subfamily)
MPADDLAEALQQHRRELHVHCYRMLGSFTDAEDAVQEAFLRAWRHRDDLAPGTSPRAWLYRIATNVCIDAIRGLRRRIAADAAEVTWLQPYPDVLLDQVPAADDEAPEAIAVARETVELAFITAMQALPPRQRAVVALCVALGWPPAEAAATLQMSVAAVNSALQRAGHAPRPASWRPLGLDRSAAQCRGARCPAPVRRSSRERGRAGRAGAHG